MAGSGREMNGLWSVKVKMVISDHVTVTLNLNFFQLYRFKFVEIRDDVTDTLMLPFLIFQFKFVEIRDHFTDI